MIIQCDACQTRFKLPDEKLKPEGVKVRCTKCETVFLVPAPPPALEPKAVESPKPPASEFDFSDIDLDNLGEEKTTDQDDFDFDEFNMEAVENGSASEQPSPPPGEAQSSEQPARDIGDELPDFNLPEDFSFEGDSNDTEPLADFSPEDLSLEPASPTNENESRHADEDAEDFSAEDLTSPPADDFSFDTNEPTIGGDLGQTFDVSDELGELPELGERPQPKVEDFGGGTADEFNFAEEDTPFAAAGQVDADDGPDSVEFAFEDPVPQAEATVNLEGDGQEAKDFIFEEEPIKQTPSAIKTGPVVSKQAVSTTPPARPKRNRKSGNARVKKRKKNKHTGLLLMLLLISLLAGGYAYLAQMKGTWDPQILLRHLQEMTGTVAPENPTAKIELLNLRSSFVSNQNSGQLFAIAGEARNGYSHTRSAISVKGVIYGPKGEAVTQQTVFCGNPLDEAALRTLPFAKIEESMNNQFGDSLSNLDVAPGTTVPFTIVFKNLPEAVNEFNVEVADSRPGTR